MQQHPYRSSPDRDENTAPNSVLPKDSVEQQQWPICEQAVLTADDHIQVAKLLGTMKSLGWTRILAVLPTFLLPAWLFYSATRAGNGSGNLNWAMIFAACSFMILFLFPARFLFRSQLKRNLKRMGLDQQTIHYEFSPDELRQVTKSHDTRTRWESFQKWREKDGYILAYQNDNAYSYQIFPVGRFSESGAAALRTFLDPSRRVA